MLRSKHVEPNDLQQVVAIVAHLTNQILDTTIQ